MGKEVVRKVECCHCGHVFAATFTLDTVLRFSADGKGVEDERVMPQMIDCPECGKYTIYRGG